MTRFILPGSLVYSTPSSFYKVGDVISYIEKTSYGIDTGKILTHRIIEKTDQGNFIAKGDSNADADPLEINKSQVQGEVKFVLPVLGYVEIIIKTIPGFLVFVFAPFMIVVANQIKFLKGVSKFR